MILYSVEWGKEKSEMWLSAMFIGFVESVIVIQPLKVLIVALLLTLIFKDPGIDNQIALPNDNDEHEKSKLYLRTRGN